MIIHAPSYSFFFFNGASIVLCYCKLEGDLFFFTWKMTLAPTLFYLAILALRYLKKVVVMDETIYKESYSVKVNHFQLLDNFFHFLFSLLLLFIVGYATYSADKESPQIKTKPFYIAAILYFALQLVYTYASRSLDQSSHLPTSENEKNTSIVTSILSPVLNFLGSSFVLCTGGTCSTIYGSTISAIFSAFGISISEWLPFLDWLTLLLVIVSVLVLYYAKKDFTYKPFLISLFAAILIFADTLVFQKRYPIYVGNVLMIGSAIWNSRLNKAGFRFGGKKQHV